MAPTSYVLPGDYDQEPISRTYQYRKVMKPMLERKRRARINRCLDELKELMVTALQSEGENVSKLEKADILELTVRHLHNLKRQQRLIASPEQSYADRFRAGFSQCAREVSHFLVDTIDPITGAKLLHHLGGCIRQLENINDNSETYYNSDINYNNNKQQSKQQHVYTPPTSPGTLVNDDRPMWRPW